jgi:hypothetical protein
MGQFTAEQSLWRLLSILIALTSTLFDNNENKLCQWTILLLSIILRAISLSYIPNRVISLVNLRLADGLIILISILLAWLAANKEIMSYSGFSCTFLLIQELLWRIKEKSSNFLPKNAVDLIESQATEVEPITHSRLLEVVSNGTWFFGLGAIIKSRDYLAIDLINGSGAVTILCLIMVGVTTARRRYISSLLPLSCIFLDQACKSANISILFEENSVAFTACIFLYLTIIAIVTIISIALTIFPSKNTTLPKEVPNNANKTRLISKFIYPFALFAGYLLIKLTPNESKGAFSFLLSRGYSYLTSPPSYDSFFLKGNLKGRLDFVECEEDKEKVSIYLRNNYGFEEKIELGKDCTFGTSKHGTSLVLKRKSGRTVLPFVERPTLPSFPLVVEVEGEDLGEIELTDSTCSLKLGKNKFCSFGMLTQFKNTMYFFLLDNQFLKKESTKFIQGVEEISNDRIRRILQRDANDVNKITIRISGPRNPDGSSGFFSDSDPNFKPPNYDIMNSQPYYTEVSPLDPSAEEYLNSKTNIPKSEDTGVRIVKENTRPRKSSGIFRSIRVKGEGGTFWIPVAIDNKSFILVFGDSSQTPSHIICGDGQQVTFHSQQIKNNLLLEEDTALTVTYPDASYLIVTTNALAKLREQPLQDWYQQLPPVTFHSHGLFNVDPNKLSSNLLPGTVIELGNTINYRNLILAAQTSSYTFSEAYFTSEYGYVIMKLPSETRLADKDDTRVCLFCLINTTASNSDLERVFGGKYGIGNLTTTTLKQKSLNQDLLRWSRNTNNLTNDMLIPQVWNAPNDVVLPIGNGYYHQLTRNDLQNIVNLTKTNSLSQNWLVEAKFENLINSSSRTAIVNFDKIYYLDSDTVRSYVFADDRSKIEPKLAPLVLNIKSDEHYLKDGLDNISQQNLANLYDQIPDRTRVFLPSYGQVLSRGWPFVLRSQDNGQVRQYFLNIDFLKSVHGMTRSYFAYTDMNESIDALATDYIKRNVAWLKPRDTRLADFACEVNPSVLVFKQKTVPIVKDMIDQLKTTLPQFFRPMAVLYNPKQVEGERVVLAKGTEDVFDASKLIYKVDSSNFTSTQEMDSVYRILGLGSVQSYIIPVNESARLEGQCVGVYKENISCTGDYSGVLKRLQDGFWVQERNYTRCSGLTNSAGCQGDYYDRLIAMGIPMNVTSRNSTFNFQKIIGPSTVVPESTNPSVTYNVACKDTLEVSSNKCVNAEFEFVDKRQYPYKMIKGKCPGALNLDTFSCTSELKSFMCDGNWDTSANILCNGTMVDEFCPLGGIPSGCFNDDKNNVYKDCFGLWDGVICDQKLFIIPINATDYVYGACVGDRIDGVSCQGISQANYTSCSKAYDKKTLCSTPVNRRYFTCLGTTNAKGCTGKMESKFRMARVEYSSPIVYNGTQYDFRSDGLGHYNYTDVENGAVIYINKTEAPLIVNSSGRCKVDLDLERKLCQSFDFRGQTIDSSTNTTVTTYVKCIDTVNLTDVSCSSGMYQFSECVGSDNPTPQIICNGTFRSIWCREGGGKYLYCNDKNSIVQDVICNGLWDGSVCRGSHTPMLIKVNDTNYVKGFCDGLYTINADCRGYYYNAEMLKCSSNPYIEPDYMKVCTVERELGNCTGKISAAGCNGTYSILTTIGTERFIFKSDNQSLYNYDYVKGESKFQPYNKPYPEVISVRYYCKDMGNPVENTCMYGIYTYMNREFDPKKPGLTLSKYWTCSAYTQLLNLKCAFNQTLTTCKGAYLEKPSVKMPCLGALYYKNCENGGYQESCAGDSSRSSYIECIDGYWDGNTCVLSQSDSWSSFKRSLDTIVKDVNGNDVLAGEFLAESFTINFAQITLAETNNSNIDAIVIDEGEKQTNGSYTNIVDLNQTQDFVMSSSVFTSLKFINLQLDNVNFNDLNQRQNTVINRIRFKQLNLKNVIIENLLLSNSTIERLLVQGDLNTNFLADKVKVMIGLGEITLYDVVINIPRVDPDKLQNKLNESGLTSQESLDLSNLNLYLPSFKVKLRQGGGMANNNFLEFPEYLLTNIAFSKSTIKHYVLGSRHLNRLN